jgi:hypothetical protein
MRGSCRAGAIALLVSGCPYRAGSFQSTRGPFAGTPVTIGCVDLGVAASPDASAQGPAVAYAFGNRCDRGTVLDLASVRARGRDVAGNDVALAAYDPADEIRPLPLDGRLFGREVIEYQRIDGAETAIAQVCVDVGRIDARAAAHEQWICLDVAR